MAYQSLYRKYRPQTFADVVGQGHVTRTIQNALISGRVGHGYLFTGTRGTAKTTVARLLAKALNCESSDKPVAEPCNRCAACVSITAGSAIDVIEMDAASHRGVADMEEVRKSVGYGPMELRFKVFIIDEAHQLSSDAKDAFLKTLEEPPANVVFILATTEPQSIPITIRSRCQQFDFKRGSMSDITGRLRQVLTCEGVTFTNEALTHIARGAEGSYRDSLSLLEQVLAFSPTLIATADVNAVLGTLDDEMLRRVTEAVARRDAPNAFALAGELLDSGKEARTLLRTLSLHFRDLLLVSVGGPAVAQELTPEEVVPLQGEARSFQPAQMMRAMEILNEAQSETRWNNQHRLLVELTFLKLMNLGDNAATTPFVSAPIVFQAASQPLADVSAARAPIVPATIVPVTMAHPLTETIATLPQPSLPRPVVPRVTEQHLSPQAPPPLALTPPPTVAYPAIDNTALPVGFFASNSADLEDDYEPDEPEDTLTPSLFGDGENEPATATDARTFAPKAPSAANAPTVPVQTPTPVPAHDEAPHFTVQDILRVWPSFLEKARSVSKMTETNMLQAHPTAVENGTVIITFRARSPYEMMGEPKRMDFVRELLKRSLSVDKVSIRFVLDDGGSSQPPAKNGPSKKRSVRDPLADLDSLSAANDTPPPPTDYYEGESFGSSKFSPPLRETPASHLPPAPNLKPNKQGDAGSTRNGYNQPAAASQQGAAAAAQHATTNGAGADVSAGEAKDAIANNALVQEVLSTFGGEIVSE